MNLTQLQNEIDAATPGAVIRVPAGTWQGTLVISRSVTLLAQTSALFDGQHRGTIIRIDAPDATVKLHGLSFINGSGEAGGAISLLHGSLEATQCTFKSGQAPAYGGGALYLAGTRAILTQCRFEANTGRQGGAVLCDQHVEAHFISCLMTQNAAVIGGAVVAKEGAQVRMLGCTLADNRVVGDAARGSAIYVGGSTTLAPKVSLENSIVAERGPLSSAIVISNTSGTLTARGCVLPPSAASLAAGNVLGSAEFTGKGSEPYSLTPRSPAVKAAVRELFGTESKDLTGGNRFGTEGACDAGAFCLR